MLDNNNNKESNMLVTNETPPWLSGQCDQWFVGMY
jgi:hypothetical protein